jgi:hypothetical protein
LILLSGRAVAFASEFQFKSGDTGIYYTYTTRSRNILQTRSSNMYFVVNQSRETTQFLIILLCSCLPYPCNTNGILTVKPLYNHQGYTGIRVYIVSGKKESKKRKYLRRHLFRLCLKREYGSATIYRRDLNSDHASLADSSDFSANVQPWLHDDAFLVSKYRVSRKTFHHLFDLFRSHPPA